MRHFKDLRRALSITLCAVLLLGVCVATPITGKAAAASNELLIGVGTGDITGPVTEISTGYNSLGDIMEGVLMKLYARAFILAEPQGERIVYVSAEMVHMTESIKPGVLKELKARGLGDLYTEQNVMLAATHCHSSPSNVSWYPLYDLVNGVPGYDDLYYDIIIDGIADAIENAHNSLQPGSIKIAQGDIENAVYNRSLEAYSWNIDANEYPQTLNNEMTLLRFEGADGTELGSLNWFGSHGTSNSIDNTYVSGDHKGYAAYKFEQLKGSGFVAAFAQSESGDASPNQPQADDPTADFLRPNQLDPSLSVIENEIVHGQKELDAALSLYSRAQTLLSSDIDYRYTTVDFSDILVDPAYIGEYAMPYDDIYNARTGEPCIGAGIMAGDEEGAPVDYAAEGEVKNTFEFKDGKWVKNTFRFSSLQLSGLQYVLGPLWPAAQGVLGSYEHAELQKEKVVALPVGDLMQTIQPLQVFTIGDLAIIGVPFECTAMQARRMKEVLMETLEPAGINEIVFSTLTNSYSQYVTTREEYAAQNYEGSTVLFGPWSGAALTQELDKLCQALVDGTPAAIGPSAPDKSGDPIIKTSAAATGVVRDAGSFGTVLNDVNSEYSYGETVTAVFQAACPRNIPELKRSGTLEKYFDPESFAYMEVQLKDENGEWQTLLTEADPYTTFKWERQGASLSSYSQITFTWLLKDAEPGIYRFRYNGVARNLLGRYTSFSGVSGEFTVK